MGYINLIWFENVLLKDLSPKKIIFKILHKIEKKHTISFQLINKLCMTR